MNGPGQYPRGAVGPPRFLPPSADPEDAEPAPLRPHAEAVRGTHRPHWATIPFQVLLVTLVFAALLGPLLVEFGVGWALLLVVAVAFGTLAYALLAWWNSAFGLREDHLVVHSGLLRKVSREIPLSRLQAVDVVRPLLMQVLGLAELRIELAGGDASAIRLRWLDEETAERLRASVVAHAAGLSGTAPEAPEWPFYRLPFPLLLGALTFRLPVLGAFLLLMVLLAAGVAFSEQGVLGGAVPILLGLLRGFLGPLTRYTDFYASLSPDGVRLRYGMFQRRMQTVPPGRVQAVRIVEPLLWRALGVVRLEVNVAGYAGERQMDSSVLLPVAPRRKAFALVDELFPGTDAAGVGLYRAARGPGEAAGLDTGLFVAMHGVFCRVIEIVPTARVQTVRLSAGPLSLFTKTAAVEVDTPPGPVRARAAGRSAAGGRRLVDSLAEYGHTARTGAAGPERWVTRATHHQGGAH